MKTVGWYGVYNITHLVSGRQRLPIGVYLFLILVILKLIVRVLTKQVAFFLIVVLGVIVNLVLVRHVSILRLLREECPAL